MKLHLVSHALCPYVQRAVISLIEKGVDFERTDINLAEKPDWFNRISPLGKTPVLMVDDNPIFESSAILEYLEDTQPNSLHPEDPLVRAQHRSWIEFGSTILNDIAGLYTAKTSEEFENKVSALRSKFIRIEATLEDGNFFEKNQFSLVDTVFGPVFRYFDIFDSIADFGVLRDLPKVNKWRENLSMYPSVLAAVSHDYNQNLKVFLKERNSYLSTLVIE